MFYKISTPLLSLCAASASCFLAASLNAQVVTFNSHSPNTATNWSSLTPVLYSTGSGAESGTTAAGMFDITLNGMNTNSFCIDLTHYAANYGVTDSSYIESNLSNIITPQQYADLNHLFSNYGNLLSSGGVNDAAFQVAIWEITNEQTSIYNLSSGNFTLSTDANVQNLAGSWLSNLGTGHNYTFSYLESSEHKQAQMTWHNTVPEPGAISLVGAAGLLLGLRRRRRA